MFEMKHISHRYRRRPVLENISLQAQAGDILAVLGASGSGKSTLLNIAAGLLAPDAGEVRLDGALQNGLPPEQRRTAMMFQDTALLPHLNVRDNAAFGLRMRRVPKHEARARADEILAEVGLDGFGGRRPDTLSGGEQQRVALARALLSEPRLLLLDEPFSALDTVLRGRLQRQIRDTAARRQIPALLVTHDPAEACMTAQRIALIGNGRLLQTGTPAELLARPACEQAARLLGCLNVSAERYVPPEAVRVAEHGQSCRLDNLFRQAAGWRAEITHPQWGALTLFCSEKTALNLQNPCTIDVNEAKIITFEQQETP